MALIGYARVSTLDQNPRLQLDALAAAGCERVFHEQASGARADRPELAAALDYLRAGDVLVVWRLDRLGRSLQHLIATVTDLGNRAVGFRSLTEAIDTTTAGGRLMFQIMGALAEFERELIRERTMAGLAAAAAAGKRGGRPPIAPIAVRAARALIEEGMPMRDVAQQLGVGRSTLYRHLLQDESAVLERGALVDVDDERQNRGQLAAPLP